MYIIFYPRPKFSKHWQQPPSKATHQSIITHHAAIIKQVHWDWAKNMLMLPIIFSNKRKLSVAHAVLLLPRLDCKVDNFPFLHGLSCVFPNAASTCSDSLWWKVHDGRSYALVSFHQFVMKPTKYLFQSYFSIRLFIGYFWNNLTTKDAPKSTWRLDNITIQVITFNENGGKRWHFPTPIHVQTTGFFIAQKPKIIFLPIVISLVFPFGLFNLNFLKWELPFPISSY